MKSIATQFVDILREKNFEGDISTETNELQAHATDESIFYVEPQVVIYPKHTQDVSLAVELVAQLSTPANPLHLTARAAGTGLSGGSLNDSVIVNTTRYMRSLISIDESDDEEVRFVLEPGIMHKNLELEMDKLEVYIPSYPASKDICTIGGMVANNAAGPDTLRYGHTASMVRELRLVLHDGIEYSITPLEWKEFEQEIKRDDALGEIYRHIWELLLHNEEQVLNSRPKTQKNSAGYALWDVVSTTVEEFVKGRGVFDLTQVICGSQGTLGIITEITIAAIPKNKEDGLLALPIFNLDQAGEVIASLLEYSPRSVEIFDAATYTAALRNPSFFKQRLSGIAYYRMVTKMYCNHALINKLKTPEFMILATIQGDKDKSLENINSEIQTKHSIQSRNVTSSGEVEMLWQIRRASYSLSKLQSSHMRPAAFLEDMSVSPNNLAPFFKDIQELFKKYNVQAFIHGHGGNGHLHFYPLMDFTQPNTAELIPMMAEEFFAVATKHKGNICGEHNDGIIRTPYLDMIFEPQTLDMFTKLEAVCDPNDIFNPGKKVNQKFDIVKNIRHTN